MVFEIASASGRLRKQYVSRVILSLYRISREREREREEERDSEREKGSVLYGTNTVWCIHTHWTPDNALQTIQINLSSCKIGLCYFNFIHWRSINLNACLIVIECNIFWTNGLNFNDEYVYRLTLSVTDSNGWTWSSHMNREYTNTDDWRVN